MAGYAKTAEARQVHDDAEEFASQVVAGAIRFARQVPLPDSAAMNMLVSKHVDAQLQFMKNKNYLVDNSWPKLAERTTEALETLARAHAEDGVRVKVTQPWHRDARDCD